MGSFRFSFVGIPCWGTKHYGPVGVSPDFLQNAFDLVFLLAFILYWQWSALLVVAYYVIETIVTSIFSSIKITQHEFFVSSFWNIQTRTFKISILSTLAILLSLFSWVLFSMDCRIVEEVSIQSSWKELAFGDHEFLIGVLAILLQQVIDYIKYKKGRLLSDEEMAILTITQVMRIGVQQLAVLVGLFTVVLLKLTQAIETAIVIAVIVGVVKLTFGQLVLIVGKNG